MTEQPIYSNTLSNTLFVDWLLSSFPQHTTDNILLVNIKQQRLFHLRNKHLIKSYMISSAANGTGNLNGSGQTPLGAHRIQEKLGSETPLGGILKGRIDTGKVAKVLTEKQQISDTDNITSRILWLSGLENKLNQGGNVDTYQRYIYIHGTDEEGRLGQPVSHGCIRMANQAVIDLFEQVPEDSLVYIYLD